MNENKVVVEFKWPWTMIPLELADEWIKVIKRGIAKTDPFYGKEIFPSARNEEQNLILVDNDTDGTSAIMRFQKDKAGKIKFNVVEILSSSRELADRIEEYHLEAMNRVQNHG